MDEEIPKRKQEGRGNTSCCPPRQRNTSLPISTQASSTASDSSNNTNPRAPLLQQMGVVAAVPFQPITAFELPEQGDRRTEARGIESRGTEARGTEARGD